MILIMILFMYIRIHIHVRADQILKGSVSHLNYETVHVSLT